MLNVLIWLVVFIAATCLFALLVDRTRWLGHLAIYLLLPAAILAWAVMYSDLSGAFLFIKFPSICLGGLLVGAYRHKGLTNFHGWRTVGYLLLLINICEAVGFELFDLLASTPEHDYGGNWFNAAAGIILIVTQAYPRFLSVDRTRPDHPVHYDLGMPWVLTYTVWDFVFIYGTIPPDQSPGLWGGFALVHLLAPLMLMRTDARLYLQYRSYTLPFALAVLLIAPFEPWIYTTPDWYSPSTVQLLGAVSLAMAIWTVFSRLKSRGDEKPGNLLETLIPRPG